MPEPCPSLDDLRAILDGRLSAEEQTTLIGHLDACTTCQATLERLASSSRSWDNVARQLRDAPTAEKLPSALLKAINRLDSQVPSAPGAPSSESDHFPFLEPAYNPGHIGQLGPYPILNLLGQGGMGMVFKGIDPTVGRPVAIKVMAPQLAASDQSRQRFLREARVAAAVRHSNVVVIHTVDEAEGLPYLVMQFIAGHSLEDHLRRDGKLPPLEVARIGWQAAAGLAAAHAQGMVHRDIKPANILIENGTDQVKITDFGLARAVDDVSLTQSGVIAGTPAYMSPEQARGDSLDHRTDLFSLGSVLYALCTGQAPFRGVGTMDLLRRVCDETPTPVREINPNVPEWLAAVIERLHAKDPAQRFSSAQEAADVLEYHLARLAALQSLPPRPKHRRVLLAASVFLLLLIASGGVLFFTRFWSAPKSNTEGGDVAPTGWVQLFTGSDLTGWRQYSKQPGDWGVKDGVLSCSGPTSHLYTTSSDYQNFHLRIEARVSPGGEGGVVFRSTFPGPSSRGIIPEGDEVKFCQMPKAMLTTASLAGPRPIPMTSVKADEWFTQEVIAEGARLIVKVNGETTAEVDAKTYSKGCIALQKYGPGVVQFRKIELMKYPDSTDDPKPNPPAPQPDPMPFVTLARYGRPEARSYTLAAAIRNGRSEDIIEVRGNGPFVEDPIIVGKKNLMIRAGEGFTPVIQLNPQSAKSSYRALLATDGSLVLEGLDLRRMFVVADGWDESLILAQGERFLAANCRFVARGPGFNLRGAFERQYEVRNCLISCERFGITWIDPPPNGSLRVENCAIGAETGMMAIVTPSLVQGQGAEIRLSRSTWAVTGFSHMSFKSERPEPVARAGRNPFLWETSENVIDFTSFHMKTGRFAATPPPPKTSEQLLRKWVTLKERNNIHGPGDHMMEHVTNKNLGGEMKKLTDWRRFWNMGDDRDYLEGTVRYVSGDLHAKIRSKPETVTADDFRLHPDGFGWRTGPGRRDPGADLDIVGPGPAYERWKKTPEYQQWLQKTAVVVTPPPPPPPPPPSLFVILARASQAEQRHATLAAAAASARNGDTIEIIGNGPFVIAPVNLGAKNLTIRAGQGFRPVLRRDPAWEAQEIPLLNTAAPLILEGLELRNTKNAALRSSGSSLSLAHCRLAQKGLGFGLEFSGAALELRNTEIFCDPWGALSLTGPALQNVVIDNCILVGFEAVLLTDSVRPERDVYIHHSTLVGVSGGVLNSRLYAPLQDRKEELQKRTTPPVRVHLDGNLLAVLGQTRNARGALIVTCCLFNETRQKTEELLPMLPVFMSWEDRGNLHGSGAYLTFYNSSGKLLSYANPLNTLAAWQNFWKLKPESSGSLQAPIVFAGQNLDQRLEMNKSVAESIQPADFRLAEGCKGKGVGPGGKDLGADVERIGPGPAYEAWRKTPEYQEWQKKTSELVAGPLPFVVLSRPGQAEQKHPTMEDAVAAARSGDTIEINGNGPFLMKPVNLGGKTLTIRAGKGSRPVLRRDPASEALNVPLLITVAPLSLEGLELQNSVNSPISSSGASLVLTHCRLAQKGLGFGLLFSGAVLELRSTEILCDPWAALTLNGASAQQVLIDNCLLVGFEALLLTETSRPGVFPERTVRIEHSTLISNRTAILHSRLYWPIQDQKVALELRTTQPLHLHLEENVFEIMGEARKSCGLLMMSFHFDKTRHKTEEIVPLMPAFVEMVDRGNLHGTSNYLTFSEGSVAVLPYADPLTSLESWQKFWKRKPEGSFQAPIQFAGKALEQRLGSGRMVPGSIQAADFRLVERSPGQGVGSGGKDLGADMGRIGPGPAYEVWRKTPEYQEWQKKTAELVAGPPVFVVLSWAGQAEQKFSNLADALTAAQNRDVVEVRGNGPFLTPALKIAGKSLTIRAGPGTSPLLQQSPESNAKFETLLASDSDLTLEGLILKKAGAPSSVDLDRNGTPSPLVDVRNASLRLLNCRLHISGIATAAVNHQPSRLEVVNCEVYRFGWGYAGIETTLLPGQQAVFDNTYFSGADWAVQINTALDVPGLRRVECRRCFFRPYTSFFIPATATKFPAAEEGLQPILEIDATACVFAASQQFRFNQNLERDGKKVEQTLRRLVKWKGKDNLYQPQGLGVQLNPGRGSFLALTHSVLTPLTPNPNIPTAQDWSRFWDDNDKDFLVGVPKLKDVNKAAAAARQGELDADSLQLLPASVQEGKVPETLPGLELRFLGPGPGYEHWKKTSQHQAWLARTGQIK
jgi:serine/threonine protein kinase